MSEEGMMWLRAIAYLRYSSRSPWARAILRVHLEFVRMQIALADRVVALVERVRR